MPQDCIIKTKPRNPKSIQAIEGAREIAKEIFGDLKVADSFLYLYRRFGKPSYDTKDEYKISYSYLFRYKGLYFDIFGTTPDDVYVDCFIPNKLAREGWKRFRAKEKPIVEKALAEGVLYFPTCYYDATGLEKNLHKKWSELDDRKFEEMFGKEVLQKLNEKPFSELAKDVQLEYAQKYIRPFCKKMSDHFYEWAKTNAPELYQRNILLQNLPEVRETIISFCKKMLETETIRDCEINIKGWQI